MQYGLIRGTIQRVADGQMYVRPHDNSGNMLLNLGERPVVVDYRTGEPVALNQRTTDFAAAYFGPAVTASIPPQSSPHIILVNMPNANAVIPHFGTVSALSRTQNRLRATINNNITAIDINTPVSTFLTRIGMTAEMIENGSSLAIWYRPGPYPADIIADRILYLSPTEPPIETGTVIQLTIGNSTALVNGSPVLLDSPPIISNERTMLPLRFISERLGYDVDWNDATRTAYARSAGTTISMQIGNNTARVNGVPVTLDAPPIIRNERTLLPIRFLAEEFGATVEWDDSTRTVTITAVRR
jgi:hypothetical protein